MHEIADILLRYDLDTELEDVPARLRHGTLMYPLGRYLRGKLRQMIGREDATPEKVLEALRAELSEVQKTAFENSESFAEAVLAKTKQKRLNALAKRGPARNTI